MYPFAVRLVHQKFEKKKKKRDGGVWWWCIRSQARRACTAAPPLRRGGAARPSQRVSLTAPRAAAPAGRRRCCRQPRRGVGVQAQRTRDQVEKSESDLVFISVLETLNPGFRGGAFISFQAGVKLATAFITEGGH